MNAVIKAKGLSKVYQRGTENIRAVDGVDLQVEYGELITLMGPSGSGKTTLLDLVGGLDAVTGGSLEVMGTDISHARESELLQLRRRGIGFIFQEFLLIPTLTALENAALPLRFARRENDRTKAEALLKRVGLEHRMHHMPRELSGGECQRVAVARALVTEPTLLLADEPTGNLDSVNSSNIFQLLRELNEEQQLTTVIATHDESLGAQTGRVIRLKDGRINES